LLSGLIAVVALFTGLWLVSIVLKNASIVDMWWGPGIFLIGLTYFLTTDGAQNRQRIVLALLGLWALRLAVHIGQRNVGHGEDFRYAKWRRERGPSWWWFSYFKVFLLQAVIAWIVAMPLYYAMAAPEPVHFTRWDQTGALIFAFGFFFEAIGDEQLRRFKANPANNGRLLNTGLWRYTRHPNYFGEAVMWWGFGAFSIAAGGYLGVVGPAIMTFLLIRVSGVALLEKTLRDTKPGYAEYIATTSSFFPMPPRRRRAV